MFDDPLWAEVLVLLNIGLALFISIVGILDLGNAPRMYRWLKVLQIIIGFYWAGLYAFVFITPTGRYNSIFFGQFFVRPAFTVTLAVMAASILFRWRAGRSKK